ncbi:MAG: type II secretion system F family protein [Candidatus Omnitrophota bacterium]|nr:type II secretion system F family protein [Candidatus Omnitrophota bacterium]
MGWIPISIIETYDLGIEGILKHFRRVELKELSTFTRQLHSMQKAGLPLLSSLEALAEQAKNKYFKIIIEEISRDIRGGLSFSSSLKNHSRIFNGIYIAMIKAAETSGNLAGILERLSALLEQEIDTKSRIKTATQYPLLAFFVLSIAFLIVITFVIPRFAVIYSQFNTLLPLPTRILISLSISIKKFWYLFILLVAAVVFGLKGFINSKIGRPVFDNFKLKVPVLGPLISLLIMARFSRIIAILMESGVPILEALDLTANTSGNIIISRAILHIKESVNQGRGMSEPMKVSNLFPIAVVQMVAVGEQTGRMGELLVSAADYYDRETSYIIKNLTTYIEPVLIFVLGVMVLIMALAIFLPMWNLIKLFKPA